MAISEGIETADALRLAGVSRQVWNDMIGRGFYTEAPPTRQGAVRYFDRDDIVSLVVFDHLVRMEMPKTVAAKICSALRQELRRTPEHVPSLWLVSTATGEPRRIVRKRPAGDVITHELLIGDVRRRIESLVRAHMSRSDD